MARFEIVASALDGILVLQPTVFYDTRGAFLECFNAQEFAQLGLPTNFVQDNMSVSRYGVLRGLHFQWDPPMGKLLRVCCGHIQLVEVDIRPDSPSCGMHWSIELTANEHQLIWIPPGFANGFLVLSSEAIVQYKCTAFYNPTGEGAIRWNDPSLDIGWNLDSEPITSEKDRNAMTLQQWLARSESRLLTYQNKR
ncbi:MAG: dTDP-4-dehydrorhamnose 3,5-epimerase [Chlorobi bacterium]|nr:dTDP-4-dehydrorhamnose 3,5-epimerase [Chlorobiota bacterium]